MFKISIIAFMSAFVFLTPAMAEGDVKAGKKVFKKCKACHDTKEGKNKVGPTMFGIYGAKSGSVEGFKYSEALAAADLVWDDETLRAFLAKPKDVVPKTKMAFNGLKKEQDLDNVIAYLKSLNE